MSNGLNTEAMFTGVGLLGELMNVIQRVSSGELSNEKAEKKFNKITKKARKVAKRTMTKEQYRQYTVFNEKISELVDNLAELDNTTK